MEPNAQLELHEAMVRVRQRQAQIRDELALPKATLAQIREGYLRKRQWWNEGGPDVSCQTHTIAKVNVSVYGSEYCATHAIIYAHGGGWIVGHSQSHDRLLRTISFYCRCPVYSVNYSLAPQAKYPTQRDEMLAVVHALSTHSQGLTLMGDSCGATLALQSFLGLNEGVVEKITGLVLIYGAYGLTESESMTQYAHKPEMTRDDLLSYERALLPADMDRAILDLLALDLTSLPPIYIVAAEHDPLRDDSRVLARKISSQTALVYHEVPGVVHEFMQYGKMLPQVDEVVKSVAQWITTIKPHTCEKPENLATNN